MTDTNRRQFLKAAAAALAASSFDRTVLAGQRPDASGIPRRPLGKTGEMVSIIGLGGYHIGTLAERESIALMHEAIERGINFFDNAWDYHKGGSEELMGKALASAGRRDKVFLMTKVCDRDYEGCKRHLDDSLRRLRTDRIDLWQFHEINWGEAPDWVFDRGGIRAAVEAQKSGKIRYIGFTGHKHYEHHLKMLGKPFSWDACQMPINVLDAHFRSFQKEVVPVCNERGVGVIGMKSLAGGALPKEVGLDASLCRRFSLSLPISTLVCGIQSRENFEQDLAVAKDFSPMSEGELQGLLAQASEPAREGQFERFKSTERFDGLYHRQQHGRA